MNQSENAISTLFFDLDGTLTDPREGITRCLQYGLKQLGRPFPPQAEGRKMPLALMPVSRVVAASASVPAVKEVGADLLRGCRTERSSEGGEAFRYAFLQ